MSKSLEQQLESLGKAITKRESAKVYQFPLWGEPQRGIPNDFARSALFAARKGVGKEFLDKKEIFCQGGISITYTGAQLTQDHLDVYEGVMHLARDMPQNDFVQFTANGLLKLIGRTTSGADYERLDRVFNHLTATSISIKHKDGRVFWGSLLPRGCCDPDSNIYKVEVNRDLIKYFELGFTLVQQEQRKTLARSPLAKHLHSWLASHNSPYPVTVQYLYDLTGSNTKELYKFRQNLKIALKKLVMIGVLESWKIDKSDKVHFVKMAKTTKVKS